MLDNIYNRNLNHQALSGFTFIEVMITMAIIGIIFFALASIIMNYSFISNFIYARIGSQSDIQNIFSRFLDELRKSTAAASGAYNIESASTSSLVFFSNITGDPNPERIRYYLDSGSLKRGLTIATGSPMTYPAGTETILILVKNLAAASSGIFSYYGAGNDVSSTPLTYPIDVSKIRVIKINLSVMETIKGVSSTRSFTTAVTPRGILYLSQ